MGADLTKRAASADVDAFVLEKHRRGVSARKIAAALLRELGVKRSHQAVQQRIDAAAGRGEPVRKRRRPAAPPATSPTSVAPPPELDALESARAAGAVPEDADDVDATRVRLRRLRTLINESEPRMLSGEMAPAGWGVLVRLEADLVDRALSQIVPAPPDPEKDPLNAATAARARKKLERLVVAAEASSRCLACGADPWAKPAKPKGAAR